MEASATAKEAKGADSDLSMEEILQSIRKIIAEDENPDGTKKAAPAAAPAAEPPKPNGQKSAVAEKGPAGSDVLELTEMVKDDGSVVSLKAEAPKPTSGDILSAIDQVLAPEKPADKPPEKQVAMMPEKPAEKPAQASADALLSSEAAGAAAASFKKLQTAEPEPAPVVTTPAPAMASGKTVEDMVYEMLKPMMKSWLDTNLPAIVDRIVEREVKKLTK